MTGENKLEDYNPGGTISSSVIPTPRLRSRAVITGILCFVLSLFFYYGTVLRVHLNRTSLLDLGPYPDAVEYFAQANSILKEGSPNIQIGYDKLPSRYPPGYPLLVVPWLALLPHNGILAPFRTNQTIGLLLLLAVFGFYFAIGRTVAAGLATLLLATQPAFTSFSRSSLSDLSGAAAAALAFALVYFGLYRIRRWPIYCAAIVLGLSLCIRPQLLFMAPLLLAMALFPARDLRTNWLIHCCLVLVVFAAASAPYLIFNALEFGSPLKTGYNFWVPAWGENLKLFSLRYAPRQLVMIWSEITANWNEFRVANLFGTGTYVVPAFILLSALGLLFVRATRFEISAFVAGGSYFVATLTYAFVDGRFYLPILFLLVAVAVLPVEWAVSQGLELRFSISTVGVLAIFLLTCIGYPSQSGFKPQKNRFQALDALDYADQKGRSPRYEAEKVLNRVFGEAPGIVLSDIDPPYLNVLLPRPFVAAPVDADHNYRYSRLWRYGKSDATRLVERGLDHATPVYALLLPSKGVDQDVQRLPVIQGYSWRRSETSDTSAVIMRLTKDAGASIPD
jgi:4-amino-4-deoxy-L-arabinose transferase-like glycosyltransferase